MILYPRDALLSPTRSILTSISNPDDEYWSTEMGFRAKEKALCESLLCNLWRRLFAGVVRNWEQLSMWDTVIISIQGACSGQEAGARLHQNEGS
jgi:hypothetical protein